jgi:hypothetical protein
VLRALPAAPSSSTHNHEKVSNTKIYSLNKETSLSMVLEMFSHFFFFFVTNYTLDQPRLNLSLIGWLLHYVT